ncbi:MAG: DEAD/DEAH box helicase family protein, partial [Floccifex sp.]
MVDPKTRKYDNLLHVAPGNIESFTGQLYDNVKLVKDENLISGKFHFYDGDIIYGKINPQLGKYVFARFEGLTSADAYVLNAKNGMVQEYLYSILQTKDFYDYSVSVSKRSGMPKINRDELNAYCYLAPSEQEQKQIGTMLLHLDNLITLHQREQLHFLQLIFNDFLQILMKGVHKMTFINESDFEDALIKVLCTKGWDSKILKYPTEEDLIQNWANILFENNNSIDRLNDCPLTKSEMRQILEQITTLRTPLKLNGFINGKTVSIKRDNPKDTLHYGKEISLKIYDRREIAAGDSRYQIAQQPIYRTKKILNDRRGDLTLLINGMPVIHIELKKSGIPISQAQTQIEKYAHEGVFTGLYSLVQIFVAMNPEEATYYANPGPDGKFNPSYYFHWADFNNERIDQWDKVASTLLSIPMAHEMIGFYTVADDADGVLKVMRSYQYYAASRISDKVAKTKWNDRNQLGGYIWHTTGSGKTLTSFKSAQLIASSKDADKVIFLMDRIELGTQSLQEYRAFADANESVQGTEDTHVLISKLKDDNPANTLIVTSIQKMSIIGREADGLK